MPRRHERGAAAVEFALVVPILILLVFGITEFGWAYHVQTTLSDAARAGVRTMALHNDVSAAKASAIAASSTVSLTADEIAVVPATCDGTEGPATVTVSHAVDLIFFGSIELTGKGTMRCNG